MTYFPLSFELYAMLLLAPPVLRSPGRDEGWMRYALIIWIVFYILQSLARAVRSKLHWAAFRNPN